ncbi:MAG TPA: MarR family transcriptional regulator [Streptosporangiaceae bacterium]
MDRVDAMVAAWRAEQPEMATLPLEVVKRTARLTARVDAATREALTGSGITYAEFDVLATLRRAGKPYRLTPGRLAQESMLTTGGTANIVQRLAAKGLVTRESHPDDGRSSWVRLTPEGRAKADAVAAATTRAYGELFTAVPDTDLRHLSDTLRKVLLALGDHPLPG